MSRVIAVKVEKRGDEREYVAYVRDGKRRAPAWRKVVKGATKAEKEALGAELEQAIQSRAGK